MAQIREGFAPNSAAPVLEILSADFFNTIRQMRTLMSVVKVRESGPPGTSEQHEVYGHL